jgi:hypothetical protein
MKSRYLLMTSAIYLGALGLFALFAPEYALRALGLEENEGAQLLMQLLGGLHVAFGYLNWMAKGTLVGGIYGRPISGGNLVLFVTTALALWKSGDVIIARAIAWFLTAAYALLAAGFGLVMYTHPKT